MPCILFIYVKSAKFPDDSQYTNHGNHRHAMVPLFLASLGLFTGIEKGLVEVGVGETYVVILCS